MASIDWEQVGKKPGCMRAKVPGGWLVWVCLVDHNGHYKEESATLTFVPDPKHEWQ